MTAVERLRHALDRAARVDRVLARAEGALLSGGVMGMAVVSVANVFGRNVLGRSLSWAEELNAILVLLITFAGIGLGAREARHIRMSAIHDQLRGAARKTSMVLSLALTSVVLAVFAVLAARYVDNVFAVGSVTPALRIPRAWIYAVVPVGLALGALQYALAVARNLASGEVHLSLTREERYEPVDEAAGGDTAAERDASSEEPPAC